MRTVDLSGTWRAIVADEDRRRTFADTAIDDSAASGWADLAVPGHWRTSPAFARTDGPLLTRRHFRLDEAGDGHDDGAGRWWLVLDGVFYQGDVWLDGHYVGDTEGYFFPHSFDVTDALSAGPEHLLAVEVTCAPQSDAGVKRNLTGSLQHSTWLDPRANPGGVWRPVRLERSGPLRIRHLRARCLEATAERAVLGLRAVIDTVDPGAATLRTTAERAEHARDDPTEHELTQVLAAGENRVEWTVEIERPDLWWPHALGDQPLYDVTIGVAPGEPADEAASSHRRVVRTGLRSVELRDWVLHVNGERMFLKGTNLGPTRQDLAGTTDEEVVADVVAARDLGLDLVRVHSHIARPELYAAADEQGMLVWQDLPLQWGYARSVRKQAVRQAREAVDLLGHHPSVAIWCGHNEPLTVGAARPAAGEERPQLGRELRRKVLGQVLPSWNRSVLDRSIRRTMRAVDGTRPVIAHSGVLPHLPQLDGTDSHLWFGWEYGETEDLGTVAARWPRLVRFVSELGAQAVPTSAGFCEPHRWPDLDWERLAAIHGLRRDLLDLIADPDEIDSFSEWRDTTQRYQAELLRRQVETLRRLKYRPTGGFAQFLLADAHPAISHSVLDHERRPKLGHAALAAACRPVIVVADPLPHVDGHAPPPRPRRELDIHVVSDRRSPLGEATVTAELAVGATATTRSWRGEIPADSCVRVGTLPVDLADARTGGVTLRLTVRDPAGVTLTDNEYRR